MEERLSKALEFANYRQTLNTQLHKIRVRTEGLLMISKNGGTFKVNQELICFLDLLQRRGIRQAPLLDINNSPIQIDDVEKFLDEVSSRYFEVSNDYLREYETVRKSRNVKTILDLKDSE